MVLAGPVTVATNGEVSLSPTNMLTCWRIVRLINDVQSHIVMSEKDEARSIAGNGCAIRQPFAYWYRSADAQYRDGKSLSDLRDGVIR